VRRNWPPRKRSQSFSLVPVLTDAAPGGALFPGVIKAATGAAGETRRRRPMTYRMSCEQLHGLPIRELSAMFKMARKAIISTRSCTPEHAEAVAAMRRIAKIIAYKDAQMRAFIPAPRRIRTSKPGL